MARRRTDGWRVPALAAVLSLISGGTALAQQSAAAPPPGPTRWGLGDVMAIALANHPAVGRADAAARAVAAQRGQAASVLWPQLAAAVDGSWFESSSSGVTSRATATSAEANVTQLLTDFGRTGATIAGAGSREAAAAEEARSARVDAAYQAAVAYFNVLRAASLQSVRRETVGQREGLLRQAQAFYDAGLKAKIDVVRAEANLYQARADAAGAEHDLLTSRLTLLNRMGVDRPADFELAGAPGSLEAAGTMQDWLAEADRSHPDLVALRLRLEGAQNDRLAASRGDNPKIIASGSLGLTGSDQLPQDREWAVAAELSVPIFNGHLTRQRTAEADANVVAARFALADRRGQVLLLVAQADQAIRDAAERLAQRLKEREAFAENLRLATGRYEAGAADIIEMVDAQVQMTTAETNLVQARFDQGTALVALYWALGRFPADR
jgi:outer membrane protein TolC